jgi:hypothetical protein
MNTEELRQAFAEVVGFAAFPVLVVIGMLAFAAVTLRGNWREGVALGLQFWVAAGLMKLFAATTWATIASAVIIITVKRAVMWSIHRAATTRAQAASTGSR